MSYHTATLHYEFDLAWETVYLPSAVSQGALNAYATSIQIYSGAKLQRTAFVSSDDLALPPSPGECEQIRYKARIELTRNPKVGDSTDYRQVVIVAPLKSMFEFNINRGDYRVKKAVGDDIAAKYSSLVGITYAFKDGYLTSS